MLKNNCFNIISISNSYRAFSFLLSFMFAYSLLVFCSCSGINFMKVPKYDFYYSEYNVGDCRSPYFEDAPVYSYENDGSHNYLVAIKVEDEIGRTWTNGEWVDGANGYVVDYKEDSIIAINHHQHIGNFSYSINSNFEESLPIILDTSEIKIWEIKNIFLEEPDRVSRYMSRYILCPEDITNDMIQHIGQYLSKEAYIPKEDHYKFNPALRESLYQFQEDNNLFIGFVDYQTLKFIGIVSQKNEGYKFDRPQVYRVTTLNDIIKFISSSTSSISTSQLIYNELETQLNYMTGISSSPSRLMTTEEYKDVDLFDLKRMKSQSANELFAHIMPQLDMFKESFKMDIKAHLEKIQDLQKAINSRRINIKATLSAALPDGDYSSAIKDLDWIKKGIKLHSKLLKQLYQLIQSSDNNFKQDNNIGSMFNKLNQLIYDLEDNDVSKLHDTLEDIEIDFKNLSATDLNNPNSDRWLTQIREKLNTINALIKEQLSNMSIDESTSDIALLESRIKKELLGSGKSERGLISIMNYFLQSEYKNALMLPKFH